MPQAAFLLITDRMTNARMLLDRPGFGYHRVSLHDSADSFVRPRPTSLGQIRRQGHTSHTRPHGEDL